MDISGSLLLIFIFFKNINILTNEKIKIFKMENYSNKIANLFLNEFKLKKGDCVTLFMENSPEYVGIWLGLSKIGVISALVNTNLKGEQLMYSIKVINIAILKSIIYNIKVIILILACPKIFLLKNYFHKHTRFLHNTYICYAQS